MVGSCGLLPWWGAGFWGLTAGEDLDDTHRAATFGAGLRLIVFAGVGVMIFIGHRIRLTCLVQKTPDPLDPVAPDAVCEEASVADAVEAGRQDMDQEPANELVRGQAHDLHSIAALYAVILPSESHGVGIGTDEAVVGDRHPMGVSAEIGQHGLGATEGRFGIDHPSVLRSGAR
jgi:hypothetical protein